jgi:hypothetical protein
MGSTTSFLSKDQALTRIWEQGEYAPEASHCPSDPKTSTVSPLFGSPSTLLIAPENIQGWRLRVDSSRLGFNIMEDIGLLYAKMPSG